MFISSCTVPQILQHVELLQPTVGEVVMILFAEDDVPDIPSLIEVLNSRNIKFFGGVFPGLIYGNQNVKKGCILKKFKTSIPPFSVVGISGTTFKMPAKAEIALIDKGTAIVLLDGLAPNIYRFLEKLNDLLGEQCNFIGGGAGSISLQQHPCIFSNQGFEANAAVVCIVDMQIHLGVRHGWEQLAGPLVATQTEGNTILQLNWESAFEVYRRIVQKDCGIELHKGNFASIAQGYPFGILRDRQDDIVRDPLSIDENGSIICIGEVPPNTVLHVLKGRSEALLDAVRKAVNDCGAQTGLPILAEGTFVVDCITRTLFLDEKFSEEMNIVRESLVINNKEQEPYGILSLGEISSYGEGLLELFNKTIVIGTFY